MSDEPTSRSILVVDDTEANLDILVAALGDDYDVRVAMDGETALEDVAESPPDLVLLDIMMPGIDGYEVLERVRRERSADDLPIIMATALGESEDIVKALKLGANDYVTKPFDLPVVLARVETQLALKASRDALAVAHRRMKRDLDAAAAIQRAFLPPKDLKVAGVELSWRFVPCDELAGDTLNVLPLDQKHVALFMADVCGHGVPSALLSVILSRLLSRTAESTSVLWRHDAGADAPRVATPAEVTGELARRFPFDEDTGLFFTLLYGVLDLEARELRYVSAGHPALVHLRPGQPPAFHGSSGPPVGLIPPELGPTEHREVTVSLGPGDRLYGYSDGIPESHAPDGAELGEEKVAEELQRLSEKPLDDSVSSLVEYVRRWRGSEAFEDDVSVLAVEIAR